MVEIERMIKVSRALIPIALAALIVGCGGSSSNGDDNGDDVATVNDPSFDTLGLFDDGADVSSVAAVEGTVEAQAEDTNEFGDFLDQLNTLLFPDSEVATLGMASTTKSILGGPNPLAAGQERRRSSRNTLQPLASVTPSAEDSGSGSVTEFCPGEGGTFTEGDGTFTEDFFFLQDTGDTSYDEEGSFTITLNDCIIQFGSQTLVLNGTWTENYTYEDRWTSDNGTDTGTWTGEFATKIDLSGTVDGEENGLVLNGSVTGTEVADYESSGLAYSEEGTVKVEFPQLEAVLALVPGQPLYIGQLDTSFEEDFEYSTTDDFATWTESGAITLSSRSASSRMDGFIAVRTQKAIEYQESSSDGAEGACPDTGIVLISGAPGTDAEVRFGQDTGTGAAVQLVTAAGSKDYATCAEAASLESVVLGPLSAVAYDDEAD